MAKPALIHSEPWDVNKRLAELGLDEDTLIRSAERGLAAYLSCTKNHPPAIPGIWAWAETICALGEYYRPLDWERVDEANWPLLVNKLRTIAVSVATGNQDTGTNGDRDPLTASAKGPRTVGAIAVNRRQLDLFEEVLPPLEALNSPSRETWLLLICRDLEKREMRCELSRPVSLDLKGRINLWAERIILKPRSFDGIGDALIGGGNGPQSPEITVEIKRRA
jgi:hypothetical protein